MKYYCIVSTIEIKTAVPPCRDINSKNCAIFATLQHFRPFLLFFKNHFTSSSRSVKTNNFHQRLLLDERRNLS